MIQRSTLTACGVSVLSLISLLTVPGQDREGGLAIAAGQQTGEISIVLEKRVGMGGLSDKNGLPAIVNTTKASILPTDMALHCSAKAAAADRHGADLRWGRAWRETLFDPPMNHVAFITAQRAPKAPTGQRPPRITPPRLPDNVTVDRDLEYAQADGVSLKLDIYRSSEESPEPRPLIVWVHGGAWRAGDKSMCPAVRLVPRGYTVASISYRLSQQAIFPAQIHDCKAAIRWLRANAAKYAIDPDRVGVWGSSAGGHLVALLGTSGDVGELSDPGLGCADQSSRVQAVCDFFGPTDLLQMDAHALESAPFQHDAADSPESRLIGGPIQENRDKVARVNPITYITPDDPPFLIVHGDQDPLVPLHQSQLLADALRQAGVACQFHTIAGAGHGFGSRRDVDSLVDAFFDAILKPAAARN